MLQGLKVLDISDGIAAPFCAKLLGDLGADVLKIEPADGDWTRAIGPFADGKANQDASASFHFFNTSKQSACLDIRTAEGQEQLRRLLQNYDIVVSSHCEEVLAELGLSYLDLSEINPAVILTTITGFGSFGPYSRYQSSHLVNCAVGGWSQLCGIPEREPLQTGGAVTDTLAGAYAAVATLLAAYGRLQHGIGEHIDVSIQEAVLAGAQIPTLTYEYRDLIVERYSSVGSGAGAGYMLPTSEGYIGLNALTLEQWHQLCRFLDREEIATEERYQGLSWATPDTRLEEVRAVFTEALSDRSADALFHEAQAWRVPFGLVPDMSSLQNLPPHVERAFFKDVASGAGGAITIPGLPFKCDDRGIGPKPSPALNSSPLDLPLPPPSVRTDKVPEAESLDLHLQGIRVVDLSMFFAGPVAAQILADAGADVFKVESLQRIDGWRGSGTQSQEGLPSWEASPYFNWVNRNKRDVTLNLKDPRGVEIVKKLVAEADVVIENFTPRVMENFGLSYEVLKSIKPDLVMISLSGFGADVSWRDYVAFGMSTEQMSGISSLTGYRDGEPLFTGMTGGDLFSGVLGATMLSAALHHRRRTGEGQHIDFSQIEACNLYLGDEVAAYSVSGSEKGRVGNRHHYFAPQGIYPCKDGWLGLSCVDDQNWQVLAGLIGRPELGNLSRSERQARHDELDALLGEWCRGQSKIDAWHRLQHLKVPAGAVLNGPELLQDPQLQARGFFLPQDRPGLGVKHYPNQPYRFRNSAPQPNRRAPLLGEHLVEILTQQADLTDDEIAELIIDDVTGTEPLAAR